MKRSMMFGDISPSDATLVLIFVADFLISVVFSFEKRFGDSSNVVAQGHSWPSGHAAAPAAIFTTRAEGEALQNLW